MMHTTPRHTRGRGPTYAGLITANMFQTLAGLELLLDAAVLRQEAAQLRAVADHLLGLQPIHPKDAS